jgi:hypothetical protein
MLIRVRRSFPWFPILLVAGWGLMMSLAIRDLAWFAAAGASLESRLSPVTVPDRAPPAAAIKLRVPATPCTAAAIVPAARLIR